MALDVFVNKFFAGARPALIGINFQRDEPFLFGAKFGNVTVPHSNECVPGFFTVDVVGLTLRMLDPGASTS